MFTQQKILLCICICEIQVRLQDPSLSQYHIQNGTFPFSKHVDINIVFFLKRRIVQTKYKKQSKEVNIACSFVLYIYIIKTEVVACKT